jgi:acetyl esterase/lipase
VSVTNALVPLSPLMTEGGKKVLMRTKPTEGPGAPVPLPGNIPDIAELRRVYNENLKPVVAHMKEVFPVDIEETTIAGISAAIITPKGGVPEKNKNRLFLNGPGGGFRTGVRGNGLLISIPVAAILGVKVVTITYRQGPEYQFPAASEDLLKVWDYYTKTYQPSNIGMVGCSAGGSLISQTTAILLKDGRPVPGVLGVYCAGLGANSGGDSQFFGTLSVTNVPAGLPQGGGLLSQVGINGDFGGEFGPAVDVPNPIPSSPTGELGLPPGINGDFGGEFGPAVDVPNPIPSPTPKPFPATAPSDAGRGYYSGVDMNQFIVNPTLDQKLLAKFPPTIFFTGTRDFAMSGALFGYRSLIKLGVDSQILVFDGLYHGFMTNPDFPEAQEGYKIAAAFYDKHLGK